MGNSDSMRRHPVTSIKKGESIIRAFNLPSVVRNNMVDQIGEESLALGLLKLKRLQNCWSVVVMVVASTNKEVDAHIPNYPNLPPQLICQLHNIIMHADVETDEVYAEMKLQPLSQQEQKDVYLLPAKLGTFSKQPSNYFCKTLTASDTSTHGGFCGDLN